MKVTILGTGGWGMALACTLSLNNDIIMWSPFTEETENLKKEHGNEKLLPGVKIPACVKYTSDLETAMKDAQIVVYVVPSFAVRETAKKTAELFDPDTMTAVCAAKGMEDGTFLTLTEVIESELPKNSKVCALSGPTHAEEVARGIPTAIVAACNDLRVAKNVQSAFMNDRFRVYTNDDIKGVEIGASVKNVIALCAGISDGCGYGDNAKAALMTRGIHEIARLGCAMGGKRETFMGLSGIGDLIVTCTSMHSRNRRCGILIGKGMKTDEAVKEVGMVVEGMKCLKAVYRAAEKYDVDMPIIREAYSIVYENKSPELSMNDLMTRDKKCELH